MICTVTDRRCLDNCRSSRRADHALMRVADGRLLEFTVITNNCNLGSRATIARPLSQDGERAGVRREQVVFGPSKTPSSAARAGVSAGLCPKHLAQRRSSELCPPPARASSAGRPRSGRLRGRAFDSAASLNLRCAQLSLRRGKGALSRSACALAARERRRWVPAPAFAGAGSARERRGGSSLGGGGALLVRAADGFPLARE